MCYILLCAKCCNNKSCADSLRNNCRPCNACNTHFECNNKNEVENNICCAADHKEVHRAFCIALSSQNGAAEEICDTEKRAEEIESHIKGTHIYDVGRSAHQLKHRTGKHIAEYCKKYAAYKSHSDSCVNSFFNSFFVACAEITSNYNITAHAQTAEKRDDKEAQRTCCPNCRKCLLTCKLADDDLVGRLKHGLHKVCEHKRNGEKPYIFHQTAVKHVYCTFFLFRQEYSSVSYFYIS